MKYKLICCATVLGLGYLSACAPLQGNQPLRTDLNRIQSKVTTLEQRTAGLENDSKIKEILQRQAEQRAELDNTRIDIQSINGQIADQEEALEQLREQIRLRLSDLELRMVEMEERLEGPTQPGTSTEMPQDQIPAPLPSTASTSAHQSTITAATTPLRAETVPEAEELYRVALQLVQEDMKFREAREKFTTFVEKYPRHELTVNAMYWIGETLYGNKKYESAILQFQDVMQMYPEHPKVPAALLKQGLAFYGLGDTRNAKIILEKVTDKYPESEEAKKAQERLEKW
ncbi:MAG: tol-pal system protein YbgF [Geobacteraceae bacterium]|nr:tol-pal system protein YbgF [Geobacteraceae bacterium]